MTEASPRLRESLEALPEIPLPDSLWERVRSRNVARIRRRRLGAGMAAALVVAVVAMPFVASLLKGPGGAEQQQSIVVLQGRQQVDVVAEVRALDLALQAAYDRGATDDEIAPMWIARGALLAGSISGNSRRARKS